MAEHTVHEDHRQVEVELIGEGDGEGEAEIEELSQNRVRFKNQSHSWQRTALVTIRDCAWLLLVHGRVTWLASIFGIVDHETVAESHSRGVAGLGAARRPS